MVFNHKLPFFYREIYQKLLSQIEQLQKGLENYPENIEKSEKIWQQIQQLCKQQVFTLTSEELEPEITQQWQSLQTELYRALRLLETEILFFQSSRQAATSVQRHKTIGDRLTQIIGYCQVLIGD